MIVRGHVFSVITALLLRPMSSKSAEFTFDSLQTLTPSPLPSTAALKEVDREFLKFLSGNGLLQFDGNRRVLASLDDTVKSGLLGESVPDEVLKTVMFNSSWRFFDLSLLKDKEGLQESYTSVLLPLNPSKNVRIQLSRMIEIGGVFGQGLETLELLPKDSKNARKLVFQAVNGKDVLPADINVRASLLLPFDYLIGGKTRTLREIFESFGSLDEQIWNGIQFTTKKMWYESGKKFEGMTVSEVILNSTLRPLISGATDKEILDNWFNTWDEGKHNATLELLESSGPLLRPSQAQLFMAPFGDGVKQIAAMSSLLGKLDTLQLTSISWSDLPENKEVDWTKLLLIARQSGYDVFKLNNASDPTTFGLRSPLELQFAILRNGLVINATTLALTSYLSLTRGQSIVLINGYIKTISQGGGTDVNWAKVPDEFWCAMPFATISSLDGESDEVMRKLEMIMKTCYHKLLPSQRVIVFWKYSQSEKELVTGLSDILGEGLSVTQDVRTSASSLLDFVAPTVFMATSSKEETEIKQLCAEGKISPLEVIDMMARYNDFLSKEELGKIKILPLSVRQCFGKLLDEYLKIKASIYPKSSKMRDLTFDEQSAIEGEFLTYLLPLDDKLESVRFIGRVPIPKLLPLVTFETLEIMASKHVGKVGFSNFSELTQLGSLAFFVGEYVTAVAAEEIRLFLSSLDGLSKCPCLPEKHRSVWARIILDVYGSPEGWSMSDLIELGDLITILDRGDIYRINKEAVRRAAPHLIRQSCLPMVYDLFPGYTSAKLFERVCEIQSNASMSSKPYKRILLEATFTNLNLVLNQSRDRVVETVVPGIDDGIVTEEDVEKARDRFNERVQKLVVEKYTKGNLTVAQLRKLKKYQDGQMVELRKVVADVLGIGLARIPNTTDELLKFIKESRGDPPTSSLKFQVLSTEMVAVTNNFNVKVGKLVGVSEKDINTTRSVFCRITSCSEGEGVIKTPFQFDPDFNIGSFLSLKNPPRSNISLCYGLKFARFAGSAISAEDLNSWPDWELLKCLETFGDLDVDEGSRMDIWKALYERIGENISTSDGVIQGGAMLFLGSLLPAAATDIPERLEFKFDLDIESLSRLGSMDLDLELVSSVASRYLKTRYPDGLSKISSENVLEFAGLGNLFCGVPLDAARAVLDGAKKFKIPIKIFGATISNCGDEQILTFLASRMERPVKDWTFADVAVNGVILAGLNPETLKELQPLNFRKVSPATFYHLKAAHLASLSPSQISNFSLEAMAVLKNSQLSLNEGFRLTGDQLSSFPRGTPGDAVVDEYRASLKDPAANLLDFSNLDDDKKVSIVRPVVDRADKNVPEPAGEDSDDRGRSSAAKVALAQIIYGLTVLVYIYLLFCCVG